MDVVKNVSADAMMEKIVNADLIAVADAISNFRYPNLQKYKGLIVKNHQSLDGFLLLLEKYSLIYEVLNY